MKKITLTNSFHKTEITVLSSHNTATETWFQIQCARHDARATKAEKAKYRKVFKALCGQTDCCCGIVRK